VADGYPDICPMYAIYSPMFEPLVILHRANICRHVNIDLKEVTDTSRGKNGIYLAYMAYI